MEQLDDEQRSKLLMWLASGEEVRWTGRPQPRRLRRKVWTAGLMGLIWSALVIWIFFIRPIGEETQPPVWLSIPFLLVAVMFFLMPVRRMTQARQSLYVITEKRVAIFDGPRIRSLPLASKISWRRSDAGENEGDIVFSLPPSVTPDVTGSRDHPRRLRVERFGFFGIPAVAEVDTLLNELSP